jgi:hypothetical protein
MKNPPASRTGRGKSARLALRLLAVSFLAAARAEDFGELQKLSADDAQDVDFFGHAVAIEGDTAIVGTENGLVVLDDGAILPNRQAAYVFVFNGTQWVQQQRLTPSDPETSDSFGTSVAIHDDTAVVGAPGKNGGGSDHGAVYVFTRDPASGQWTEQQKLTASDAADDDQFGGAVAIDGDTLLTGATGVDGAGSDRGQAYIFKRVWGNWSEAQKLTASDAEDSDHFGSAVALSGGVALIGAPLRDGAGTNRGGAYVFTFGGAAWAEAKILNGSDAADGNFLGFSVALNAAGSALAGAPSTAAKPENGAAYLFTFDGSTWTETKKFNDTSSTKPFSFGRSVALGDTTAVATCFGGATAGGKVRVFTFDGANWSGPQTIVSPDQPAEDSFGGSVSLAGDVLLVGASDHDNGGVARGAAYLFQEGLAGPPPTLTVKGKKKIKTAAARLTLRGTSTGAAVEAAYKVGKKKRTKIIPVIGGAWKFKIKPRDGKTKITFTAVNADGLRSAPQKRTIIKKRPDA